MAAKRRMIDLSQLRLMVPADNQQVAHALDCIERGVVGPCIRGVTCDDGFYAVADPVEAAWVEARRRRGLKQVQVAIQPADPRSQVQKALDALHTTPIDPALSERELARQLGVSRSTLHRAILLQPPTTGSAQLQLWEGQLLEPQLPLQPGSVDLIASCAPGLPPAVYAPGLARLLSERGILWLIIEAHQWEEMRTWFTALDAAGLAFRRLAAWVLTATRSQRNPRLTGYRLLLSFGKAGAPPLEDVGQVYPGWTGPRALAEVDPSQRIIPVWLWKRWLAEQPAGQVVLDCFATSTTVFDAARSQPQLREAWACPVDETARSLLQHYLEHQF